VPARVLKMRFIYSKKDLFLAALSFLLVACSDQKIFSYSVDEIAKNPRLYEGKVVSVKGTIRQTDQLGQVTGYSAKISGSGEMPIYLSDMAAKVQFGREVVVNGQLSVLNIPVVGTYIVLDAKSVIDCAEKLIC
jgi:hypothetical protein